MRLSRPRVILRGALLLLGAGYMFFRALDLRSEAATAGDQAGPLRTFALVQGLVGVLCLGAAAVAFLALRRRARKRTLRLSDLQPPRDDGDGPPPAG